MERNKNIHIPDCSLVVSASYSFLGASPDGKVCDNGNHRYPRSKVPLSCKGRAFK